MNKYTLRCVGVSLLLAACDDAKTDSCLDPLNPACTQLLIEDFDGEPEDRCALNECETSSDCSDSGIPTQPVRGDTGESHCPLVFCDSGSSCFNYEQEQNGHALVISNVIFTVREADEGDDGCNGGNEKPCQKLSWVGYSIPLSNGDAGLALESKYDCLSFLVNVVALPEEVRLEIALKDGDDPPAETSPKKTLDQYALIQPGWCRVQIPVSDLLSPGGEPKGTRRDVTRENLDQINFLLTTTKDTPPGTLETDIQVMLDSIGFEECGALPNEGTPVCAAPQ